MLRPVGGRATSAVPKMPAKRRCVMVHAEMQSALDGLQRSACARRKRHAPPSMLELLCLPWTMMEISARRGTQKLDRSQRWAVDEKRASAAPVAFSYGYRS